MYKKPELMAVEAEEKALVATREEFGLTNGGNLTWYPSGKPQQVIIKLDGKYVSCISQTGTHAELYKSWIPVLEERNKIAQTNGIKRVSHKNMKIGQVPESEN